MPEACAITAPAPIVAHLANLGIGRVKGLHAERGLRRCAAVCPHGGLHSRAETSHAIRAAIDEALKDDGKCIVFNYSGHGHFDMSAYDAHLAGDLEDYEHPEEKIAEALRHLAEGQIRARRGLLWL